MALADGDAFLRQMRARPDLDQLPVVVMSADPRLATKTVAEGVHGTLLKPFSFEALLSVLEEHCGASV
jgi:CheY-like chemotaxis protein